MSTCSNMWGALFILLSFIILFIFFQGDAEELEEDEFELLEEEVLLLYDEEDEDVL